MKKILPKIISLLLIANWGTAQENNWSYKAIYPQLPFDQEASESKGNEKTTVWYGTYTKGEGDEPGYIWSNPVVESYPREKYHYYEGKMQKYTRYYPNGDKLLTEEYFYKDDRLKATEKLVYDTLRNSRGAGGWVYIYYDNGKPFQRVRLFGFPNKNVRLLDEFKFENQKIVRQKTTAVGYGPDMDSLLNGMKDKEVLIQSYQYKDTMEAKQVFKDLYRLQEEAETYYDAEGYPKKTVVTNAGGKIIVQIEQEYTDGQCTKKTHWVPLNDSKELAVYKVEYFTYDEGLISMHIIEENGVQTVLEYTHFTE